MKKGILPTHRIPWHVLFVHFPISLFGVGFVFQILHFFAFAESFELASDVTLLGGTIMMVPTTLTGWLTWKKYYNSAKVKLFQRKIIAAFAMLAICVPLAMWRITMVGLLQEVPWDPSHWIYVIGDTLLILGAVVEGYYGGLLHHR